MTQNLAAIIQTLQNQQINLPLYPKYQHYKTEPICLKKTPLDPDNNQANNY